MAVGTQSNAVSRVEQFGQDLGNALDVMHVGGFVSALGALAVVGSKDARHPVSHRSGRADVAREVRETALPVGATRTASDDGVMIGLTGARAVLALRGNRWGQIVPRSADDAGEIGFGWQHAGNGTTRSGRLSTSPTFVGAVDAPFGLGRLQPEGRAAEGTRSLETPAFAGHGAELGAVVDRRFDHEAAPAGGAGLGPARLARRDQAVALRHVTKYNTIDTLLERNRVNCGKATVPGTVLGQSAAKLPDSAAVEPRLGEGSETRAEETITPISALPTVKTVVMR